MVHRKANLSLVEEFSIVNLKKGLGKKSLVHTLVLLGWNLRKMVGAIHHLPPVFNPMKPIPGSSISGGDSFMQQPGPV